MHQQVQEGHQEAKPALSWLISETALAGITQSSPGLGLQLPRCAVSVLRYLQHKDTAEWMGNFCAVSAKFLRTTGGGRVHTLRGPLSPLGTVEVGDQTISKGE